MHPVQVHHDTEQLQEEFDFLLQAYQSLKVNPATGQAFPASKKLQPIALQSHAASGPKSCKCTAEHPSKTFLQACFELS